MGRSAPPVISFLSDYGLADEFVGVCHGVIARLCPAARVIDVTHGVPRHDVVAGALALRNAVDYLPAGVHLAVVDPTVGASGPSARRAVALRSAGERHLFVGPDNGLLTLAAEHLGGVVEAVDVGRSPHALAPVSATFHGRDIFAPVAAALAGGAALDAVGEAIPPTTLATLPLSRAHTDADGLHAHVLALDGFGNLLLDADRGQLDAAGLRPGASLRIDAGAATHPARYATAFADVAPGELLVYEDAARMIAIAVNRGSAAERLGLRAGSGLLVTAAR